MSRKLSTGEKVVMTPPSTGSPWADDRKWKATTFIPDFGEPIDYHYRAPTEEEAVAGLERYIARLRSEAKASKPP